MEIQPAGLWDFNPRSPRGERRGVDVGVGLRIQISIHAPRGGSDLSKSSSSLQSVVFQSTLPAGGATSHSPYLADLLGLFQSTLPAGGATR